MPFNKHSRHLRAACALLSAILFPSVGWAQASSETTALQITVNSAADGAVQPDDALTLREAIEIVNGTLPISALSAVEQQLVSMVSIEGSTSTIQFNLPLGQTAIELLSVLPAIAQPSITIDGTTQPGYSGLSATAEIDVPTPAVTLRPAPNAEIFRGLTIAADNIVVRGLNLYGFNAASDITQSTPPADIFISHQIIPLNRKTLSPDVANNNQPPSGVVIEQNWLGLTADGKMPDVPSGFGVSVFDSTGTTIQRNRIEYHNGSGIITGREASNLKVVENIIVGNGLAGIPDAIRLDGRVDHGWVSGNLICGNDGSGVFLFKPEGAVSILDNDIRFNGQRLRRAAVYVMGDGHQILNNKITNQRGSGVVVTAYGQGSNTQSQNNVVTGNRFKDLEGLSVDLNARRGHEPQNFRQGDGPNPQRNSHNRRQDTGNGAVNAPQFVSLEFFVIDGKVAVRGQADAGNEVQLYRSEGVVDEYGPLSEPVAIATANHEGNFEFVLEDMTGGEVLSAIATDSRYGTSEPARNTTVRSLTTSTIAIPVITIPATDAVIMPQCTTPPSSPIPSVLPSVPNPPVTPPIPETIQLEAPRNVHFGLDQDSISLDSAIVLDKIAAVLTQYPSIAVDLHGHTDSRASADYNQDLARRRAENARRYLLSKGIGPERMTLRSFGETELLLQETELANYARNRRVEFVFRDIRGIDINFVNQENDLQVEP